jgi:hypothetical protein
MTQRSDDSVESSSDAMAKIEKRRRGMGGSYKAETN